MTSVASRARRADPRLGRLVGGKWRLDAVIGEGATSIVFSATHRTSGGRAAIKILHAMYAGDRTLFDRFLAEGYLVAGLDHPGVAKVLDDGVTEDGSPYLVLELLVGQTLEELRQARGGRIPLEEMMPIADAVMETLAAVHDAGITHRDLKPQNVMVLDGGGVKVLDFGLAKQRGHTADASENVVGTPSFMPPEQALGLVKKMDAQSDVWALGAMLFHALSGQPVHLAKHVSAMILASASTRPRSLADAAPELPSAVVEVVDHALAYRKAERWDDVRAMRSAWQAAHPNWLPTLPPPSFVPDPAFLDPNSLVSDLDLPPVDAIGPIETPMAIALFDPRELAAEARFRASAPELPPLPPIAVLATPSKARWPVPAMMIASAIATVTLVTAAIILSADDSPRQRAVSIQPPQAAMELPLPKR